MQKDATALTVYMIMAVKSSTPDKSLANKSEKILTNFQYTLNHEENLNAHVW